MAGAPRYRHTQPGWVIIVAMSIAAAVGGSLLTAAGLQWAGWFLLGLAVIVGLLFGSLTIVVDDQALSFHFGVGLIRKRIALSDIRAREAAVTPWYFGWGIRVYPGGWLYNVSGTRSVELWRTDGSRLRVGTDEPEAVLKALDAVAGPAAPLSATERQESAARGRRFGLAIAVFVIAICGVVGAMFYAELKPPEVAARADGFSVASGLYGVDEVPWSSVTSVSLQEVLPAILSRTNGFAVGDTLRGHFQLDGVGAAVLYLEAGHPPYIQIQRGEERIYVGFERPERTHEVYKSLDAAWRASR